MQRDVVLGLIIAALNSSPYCITPSDSFCLSGENTSSPTEWLYITVYSEVTLTGATKGMIIAAIIAGCNETVSKVTPVQK